MSSGGQFWTSLDKMRSIELHDVGAPEWTSGLIHRIRTRGPKRAGAAEWKRFIVASAEHAVSVDEIRRSQVLDRLAALAPTSESLHRTQVQALVEVKPMYPRLAMSMDVSFIPSEAWAETASLIPAKQYAGRGLLGRWPGSVYVLRYRHRSLGWSVARARHSDLFVRHADPFWLVLDPKGVRAPGQPPYGFANEREAKAHASSLMRQAFLRSAKARHAPRWERFSNHGMGPYGELLVTLPGWHATFFSQQHFPGIRNLLLHLRFNVCDSSAGRTVLFLDEVQSDWHAHLAAQRSAQAARPDVVTSDAPFAREWPLLALKLALWWAARQGLEGVAWSPPELHQHRWRGYNPPTEVYRRGLPQAAAKLAALLKLELAPASLIQRRVAPDRKNPLSWRVLSQAGTPCCRAFERRTQALRFADLVNAVATHTLPVLWLRPGLALKRVPLFGAADPTLWG